MAPLICIVGPTAAGKSQAALELAQRFPVEIVSVDSALVYRGMDIGTAKPTAAERRTVAHHLIDLIEPATGYSAARFLGDAQAAIAAIRERGRIPLLVGGTMLYFKALREGLDALPSADSAVRSTLEAEAERIGWPALHARLARVDPVTAARLAPTDGQRIQRALEVFTVSGRALSAHFTARKEQQSLPERFVYLALEPSSRAELHLRIARRFAAMLEAGFLDEVRALRARGDLHAGLPSMRCVGYRQAWQFLEGSLGADELGDAAIAATRQLAKRQLTWLRALPERVVVDCLAPDFAGQIGALAAPLLEQG